MTYYNTNRLKGSDLLEAIGTAKTQQEAIFYLFRHAGKKGMSPSDVWELLTLRTGKRWVLTSVRRAMTDLTTEKKLLKTVKMKPGHYGKPEHIWVLHPSIYSNNPTLF